MTPAHIVEIQTPKGFTLNGIWYGPRATRRVYVFVHGLGGSVFGEAEKRIIKPIVSNTEAVLVFNNRGHDIISKLYGDAPKTRKGYKRIVAGSAHEVFTDCVDDIEGVVRFLESRKVKEIVLIGHSTGCQKSIYWASKKGRDHRAVKGIVLLAPMSDRAAYIKEMGETKVDDAIKQAKQLVKAGKPHELVGKEIWNSTADAQRLVSLADADSKEEIFNYHQSTKPPKTFCSVHIPILTILAEGDEYSDRSAEDLYWWFLDHTYEGEVTIIPDAPHSFKGREKKAAILIKDFMKETLS